MGKLNRAIDVFTHINTHGNDPNVCWEWTGGYGGREGDERGYMRLNGRKQMAHRIVFEIFNPGVLNDNLVVRHMCDNSVCCNPYHLELGNRRENELDKYRRDRAGYPSDVVKDIRRFSKLKDITDQQIADMIKDKYKITISRQGVQKVRSGTRRAVTK